MKKIIGLFTTYKHTIIWTICYILAMKFVLSTLFNFDMFSADAWIRLSHSHLHGFGGMVFGILVLSALPLYAATTSIIIRTKKPLFQIPVPQFIVRAFAPPAPPKPETEEPAPKQEPEPTQETFPAEMPTELHAAFIRARHNGSIRQAISAFDSSRISANIPLMPTEANDFTDASDFPLPTDFDTPESADTDATSFPTFTDINFDDDTMANNVTASALPDNTQITSNLGNGAHADGDFIIYKENLIAVHNDPDFWIADDTDWFASGKQRPSPITAVKTRATELKLRPVLYLAENNILDIDTRIEQWHGDGITVITNLDDLN